MGIFDKIKANSLVRKVYWKLEKLTILSFKDVDRKQKAGSFEVMFNPESYSLAYENIFGSHQALNTTGRVSKYTLSKPSNLSLKLILDGTGVSEYSLPLTETFFDPVAELRRPWSKTKSVSQRIDDFVKETAAMDGDLHEPRFLIVQWGDLEYPCRLKNFKINYTLFDKGGSPLRAEIDVVFFYETTNKKRLKLEGKKSPDLTHKRIVKSNDTLPLLCHEIYGSADYYLQVARANNLVDFRNLTPGQELFFPPIEK